MDWWFLYENCYLYKLLDFLECKQFIFVDMMISDIGHAWTSLYEFMRIEGKYKLSSYVSMASVNHLSPVYIPIILFSSYVVVC